MIWEDLTDKEREEWNVLAQKYQKQYQVIIALAERRRCFQCKAKFPNGLLTNFEYDKDKKPVKINPRGDFVVHYKTTHGFPPDLLSDLFDSWIRE